MCEQLTLDNATEHLDIQTTYLILKPQIDIVLERFNFSPSHIVVTEIKDGLSIRYNIERSIFADMAQDEQEDPPGVKVIFRLTKLQKGIRIEIPANRLRFYSNDNLPLVPTNAKVQTWRKIDIFSERLPALSAAICSDISDYLLTYPSDFGCCGLYEKCSDAGRCIQLNQDMAASCYYKKNLIRGKIFYGKHIDKSEEDK